MPHADRQASTAATYPVWSRITWYWIGVVLGTCLGVTLASSCYGLLAIASKARGYWLLLRVGGPRGLLRYERERKVRERFYGRRFDPKVDGIDLLHFIGASNASRSRSASCWRCER